MLDTIGQTLLSLSLPKKSVVYFQFCKYKIVVGRDGTLPGGEYYVSSVKKTDYKVSSNEFRKGPHKLHQYLPTDRTLEMSILRRKTVLLHLAAQGEPVAMVAEWWRATFVPV